MCGIVAIIDREASSAVLTETGSRMLDIQQHRGPDHTGWWLDAPVMLGHNRLSIIDVSAASHQPMARGTLTITFNGEIYNYVELRAELTQHGHNFNTTGDTEVVLAALQQWGHSAVERFIGMWAFAVWDSSTRELFCSRDRFGIKPFHFIERGGRLYIASEIKAVRQSPLHKLDFNLDQVVRGLYLGWMQHWEDTYYSDVTALPGAHNLLWKDGVVRVWQYAEITGSQNAHVGFDESVETFRTLFTDSIRLTSRRDVPMGVCLSGGLDSTSIAATLATSTTEQQVRAFTAFYTGPSAVDERPYIRHLLDRYPVIQSHEISPTDADVAEAIMRIVHLMDAPIPSSSYVSQYFVMRLAASNGIKVVLDGQGSDEILGGYMHSLYRVIADKVQSGNLYGAAAELRAHAARQHYGFRKKLDVLAKTLLTAASSEHRLYQLELARTYPWISNTNAQSIPIRIGMHAGSRLNAFLHNLVRVTLLPTLLHTEDINSMAFGIESRVPFLDHRLVDACFAMPNDHKVLRGETKRVLRAAMRGRVPDAILDRKDKTGFITPGHLRWLRGSLSYLTEGSWDDVRDVVALGNVESVIQQYRSGDNTNALFVWRLAMLRAFIRQH